MVVKHTVKIIGSDGAMYSIPARVAWSATWRSALLSP